MTTSQAASRSGLDASTIQDYCRDGRLRAKKLRLGSKSWRWDITPEALKRFRDNRRKAA